jgi:hypothetical protein
VLCEGSTRSVVKLTAVHEFLPRADALAADLADLTAIAEGDLPELETFASDWGRGLLPPAVLESPPDVLVLVPNGLLHVLPLHLVRTNAGFPLACESGVAYSGSMSLFCRCAMLNPARMGVAVSAPVAVGGGVDVLRGDAGFDWLASEVLRRFGAESSGCTRYMAKFALQRDASAVVCLVAHGYADPHQQRASGLLVEEDFGTAVRSLPLSGGRLAFDDLPLRDFPPAVRHSLPAEVLTLQELETIASSAQLTLLLACAAGSARVLQTDEPASLAETLVRAGSASVIAPMWASRLDTTHAWVSAFLDAWIDGGLSKALAVRHAFRALDSCDAVASLGPLHLRGDWL